MSHDFEPLVGHWYRHLDKGQAFEVIAVDESQAMVEVQAREAAERGEENSDASAEE